MKVFELRGGTAENPIPLQQRHINAIIKAGYDADLDATIEGYFSPQSGSIYAHEKYRIENLFPNARVLAEHVLESSFEIGCDYTDVNEGGFIDFWVTGMDINDLKVEVEHNLTVTDYGGLSYNDILALVKSRTRIEGTTIYVDGPQENCGWRDVITVNVCPVYEDMKTSQYRQYFSIIAHAIAVKDVEMQCGDTYGKVKMNELTDIKCTILPLNHTKQGSISYSHNTLYGELSVIYYEHNTVMKVLSTAAGRDVLRMFIYMFGNSVATFTKTLEFQTLTDVLRCAYGRWWKADDSLDPKSVETVGDRDMLMGWYPYLIDMSPVRDETAKTPVGELMMTNWLRFKDGSFAPTVGITEAQRAECDGELYLDAGMTRKYCEAGMFNAEAFYNTYGMSQKLYNNRGESVRILRPWETTETKYSIFIGRKDDVMLIDNVVGSSGFVLKGIALDDGLIEGTNTHSQFPLKRTGLNPGPITTVGNKARCFFFDYCPGDTNTKGAAGTNNIMTLFFNNGAYGRVNDCNAYNNAVWARGNNFLTQSPTPVAEGGYHARNVWMTCAEAAFGTKYLHASNLFGAGMSSNYSCNNEEQYLLVGGIRCRVKGTDTWEYRQHSGSASILRINASGGTGTWHASIPSTTYQRMKSLEAQMAMSFAVETGVKENVEFEFYGTTYRYQCPDGIESIAAGYMNVRLYAMKKQTVNAYNASGQPTVFDVEFCLLNSLVFGKCLCGEMWEYTQGGYEMIQQNEGTTNIGTKVFIQCDQSQWWMPTTVVQGANTKWAFEDTYNMLGIVQTANFTSGYLKEREAYTNMRKVAGGSLSTGECTYTYEGRLSSSANYRSRPYVVFGGALNYSNASARYSISLYLASYTYYNYGGSAQVLLA